LKDQSRPIPHNGHLAPSRLWRRDLNFQLGDELFEIVTPRSASRSCPSDNVDFFVHQALIAGFSQPWPCQPARRDSLADGIINA